MKNLISVVLLLVLCSCGTDTGNPGIIGSIGNTEGDLSSIGGLISTVCNKLNNCNGSSINNCSIDIYSQTNIDTELGLTPGGFDSLNEVYTAETNGSLTVDETAQQTCNTEIEALACTDTEVINAYDPMAGNPFEGVADMLPDSCENFYQ